jgi:hypothetical protein
MPKQVFQGRFYEFSRGNPAFEVGDEINEAHALQRVRFGKDVYTLSASDAKRLARRVSPFTPFWHPAENSRYFSHFHTDAGGHGHIFYGYRGENSRP